MLQGLSDEQGRVVGSRFERPYIQDMAWSAHRPQHSGLLDVSTIGSTPSTGPIFRGVQTPQALRQFPFSVPEPTYGVGIEPKSGMEYNGNREESRMEQTACFEVP